MIKPLLSRYLSELKRVTEGHLIQVAVPTSPAAIALTHNEPAFVILATKLS